MVKMFSSPSQTPNRSPDYTHNDSPLSSSPSSSDFQILSVPANGINGTYSLLEDWDYSIHSPPSGCSAEDMQALLIRQAMEAKTLHEAIQQSNFVMKAYLHQYEALKSDTCRNYEEKLKELEEVISDLRSENNKLKDDFQKFQDTHKECSAAIKQSQVLKIQMSALDEKLSDFKQENDKLSIIQLQLQEELADARAKRDKVQACYDGLLVEKHGLVDTNKDLTALVDAQNQQLKDLQQQDTGLLFKTETQRSAALTNELAEERKKRSVLEKDVREMRKHFQRSSDSSSNSPVSSVLLRQTADNSRSHDTIQKQAKAAHPSSEQQGMLLLHNLKTSGETITAATSQLQRYDEQFMSIDTFLQECEGRLQAAEPNQLEQLRKEVSLLRSTLANEKSSTQEARRNLSEARNQFELLLGDYQELLRSVDKNDQEQINRNRQLEMYFEIQVNTFKEQLDAAMAHRVCAEEAVADKTLEISSLKTHMQRYTHEMERIPILQAQMELYQSDFTAEREARQQILQAKERIAEDLRQLQIRNQQLQDELEAYQQSQFSHLQGRSRGVYSRASQDETTRPGVRFENLSTSSRELNGDFVATVQPLSALTNPAGRRTSERLSGSPAFENGLASRDLLSMEQEEALYYCPKCNRTFTELRPLESHVNTCLDNDDPFL